MAEEHYGHLGNCTQHDEMVQYMRSGPIVPMVWAGKNAIEKTMKLIGQAEPGLSQPGTIRSDFGADGLHNIIYGSLSNETAIKEIGIWFHEDELVSWTAADEKWTQFYSIAIFINVDNHNFVFLL
ncbi:MAG: hypothetical protein EOP45_23120 [Sphingobacteriaceae bacterium]|nr:MAG: hypothetical protein EOP45_23120 [Sphingobacteriaceae bacterium]